MSPKNLLELYLGYECNAFCAFCYNPDGRSRMPFEEAAKVMYDARLKGYERLDFIGGEPTVYRDIVKAVALGKKLGFGAIGMYTNGLRLSDPRLTRDLGRAGLDTAFVALHGHTPRLHDAITGVPGSFEKVLTGLKNLREQSIQIKLVCVLDALNYRQLPEFCEYFISLLGVPNIRIIRVFYAPGGRFSPGRDAEVRRLMVTMSQAAPFIVKAMAIFRGRGLEPPTVNHFNACIFPGNEQGVLERLHPLMEARCPDKSLNRSPQGGGDGAEILELKPEKCLGCEFYLPCPGVEKGYLDLFGDRELVALRR